MFDKIQRGIQKGKEEHALKRKAKEDERIRSEAEYLHRKNAALLEQIKQDSAEAQRQKQLVQNRQRDLADERIQMLSMDNKQLMVELILAIRGFSSEMGELEEQQIRLEQHIEDLEQQQNSLRDEIACLDGRICELDSRISNMSAQA